MGLSKLDNILYLDDEQNNLETFQVIFKDDYNVFIASTPQDATQIIDKKKIKVFITDLCMPETSGLDLLNQIKLEYPNIICIILTDQV